MIDSDSDSRLVVTAQGSSDSDSDSARLVMVMHSTHNLKNPGLPTLIYRSVTQKKGETGEAQVFSLSVRSAIGQCHGLSNDSGQQ